jgi:hypothetical protein
VIFLRGKRCAQENTIDPNTMVCCRADRNNSLVYGLTIWNINQKGLSIQVANDRDKGVIIVVIAGTKRSIVQMKPRILISGRKPVTWGT